MNFSGIIEMDEIPAIQELLKDAKSFCCYGFDCYERYWDITDEEYLAQLETKREEITHEILERCRTKRKNLYITGPVALNVAQKFSVHRLCDKEGKHNLANRFVGELMAACSRWPAGDNENQERSWCPHGNRCRN